MPTGFGLRPGAKAPDEPPTPHRLGASRQLQLLAAHRCGLAGVILSRGNEREVDEEVGEELRRAVEVHYVTRLDELLELALEPAPSSAAPVGRGS